MKKFFSYLCAICALLALGLLIYQAIPIFPYINDMRILIDGSAFLLFYYLAYKLNREKKDMEVS
jgi:hypothetical protein